MRYVVKSVVCDYGVYEKTDSGEQLKVICNSLSNAELIADILNTDLRNTKYEVIKKSKIDKAIKEIEGEYSTCNQDWIDGLNRALDILKKI